MPNSHLPPPSFPAPREIPLSVGGVREKLVRHSPTRLANSGELRHAAVVLLLREAHADAGAELLIIGRAEHPDDPWSGHLGFPGGRVESTDATPEHAALRETEEELGLDLGKYARRIGALSELRARAMMRLLPMSIFPFVYELIEPVAFRKNEEVATTCWVPLDYFLNPANRSTMPHPREPDQSLPCYPLGDRIFWGLSLAMLDELLHGL